MPNVKLESLIDAKDTLQSIRKTIIDTGTILSTEYKNQEQFWQDPKYKKIGKIILKTCEDFIVNIQILDDCSSKLEKLQSFVEEYHSMNLSDLPSSDFASSLRGQTVVSSNDYDNPELYYCGDVRVVDGALDISIEYRNMIEHRIENATAKAREVYKTYCKRIKIQSANFLGRAGYYDGTTDGYERGIYYNQGVDSNGDVFFHSFASMLDHLSKPCFSDHSFFANCLYRELNHYHGDNSEILQIRNYSDTLAENGFATFFQASMGNQILLDEIQTNFPNSYREFDYILENMIGHGERIR